MDISQIVGFVGAALVIIAYFPQVIHLVKERCSAGISLWTYGMWLMASLLLFIHALMINDIIFITLQVLTMALTLIVSVYAYKYRYRACQSHLPNKK